MSRLLIAALAATLLASPAAFASENDGEGTPEHPQSVTIKADTRFDFDYTKEKGEEHTSGFHGRFLNLIIDANISSKVAVHWRQRMNKFAEVKNDVFYATDFVYIDYSPTEHWTLSGGKQIVAIGGYEYDRNPINIYYASMFWNNIGCYQFGVSATYHSSDKNHSLLFQVCNSPYAAIGKSCYAYNAMWMGKMGCFNTLWSANLVEYERDKYGQLISLGNKFDFGNTYVEIDVMNRYFGHQAYFFDDYSLIGKVCTTIDKVDIFAKGGYEHYAPVQGVNQTIDKPFYGLGVEYYPLKNSRNLRFHLVGDVTHDSATGKKIAQVSAGFMWRVTLFNR